MVLERIIGQARRRLNLNVTLEMLAIGGLVAAGGLSVFVIVDRMLGLSISPIIGLSGAALVAAAVIAAGAWRKWVGPLPAALAIDAAAGLKERVSSALVLPRTGDAFADAARLDAERVAARLHVPSHIPLRVPRLWGWTASAAISAALLYLLFPQLNLLARVAAAEDEAPSADVLGEKANIRRAFEEQAAKARQKLNDAPAMQEVAAALEKLEFPETTSTKPDDVRREALKQIESVTDKLREKLGENNLRGIDELKKELAKLDSPKGDDPASKLSQSLSNGDMEGAKKSLSELKKQLEEAAKSGDENAKQKLGEMSRQMEELARQLEKLADAKKLQEELQKKSGLSQEDAKKMMEEAAKLDPKQAQEQLEQRLKQAGMSPEQAKELAQKLADKRQAMQQAQKLQKAMEKAAKAAQQCQNPGEAPGGASEAMSAAMGEAEGMLSELEMSEQMMNEINSQLSDLKKLSEATCQGGFCPSASPNWDRVGNQGGNEGLGFGARIGETPTAHQMDPTKANIKQRAGQIVGQQLVDGPMARGEASAAVQEALSSAVRDAADAIEKENVPRQYEGVLRKYFESLAGLQRGDPAPDAPAKEGEKP